jgi:hypothetical protein
MPSVFSAIRRPQRGAGARSGARWIAVAAFCVAFCVGVSGIGVSGAAANQLLDPYFSASPQIAQSSEPAKDSAYRSGLLRILQTGSVDDILHHAQTLIEAERYERAAGLLHSLLIRAPDDAEVKLLLARLYLGLGVRDQAELYAGQALQAPRLSADQRRRADQLVTAARAPLSDEALKDGALRFDGSATLGFQYSTNATGGTNQDRVLVNGQSITTPDTTEAKEDANLFASVFGRVRAPLGETSEFDGRGFLFMRKQHKQGESDLFAGRLEPGVTWDLGSFYGLATSVRPYLAVSFATAQKDLALLSGAVGLESVQRLDATWRFSEKLEIARFNYRADVERPSADQQDSTQAKLDLRLLHDLGDGLGVQARYDVAVRNAAAPFNDRLQQRIGAGVSKTYATTLILDVDRPSRVGLDFTYAWTNYDEPNPAVSDTTARQDSEWEVELSHRLPVAAETSVDAGLTYGRRESNLSNYEREEIDITLSVSSSF